MTIGAVMMSNSTFRLTSSFQPVESYIASYHPNFRKFRKHLFSPSTEMIGFSPFYRAFGQFKDLDNFLHMRAPRSYRGLHEQTEALVTPSL